MKKSLILLFMLITMSISHSQVFNTAAVLEKGSASIGVNPIMFAESGNNEFAVFFRAGYGLVNRVDLSLNVGVNYFDETYIGADIEWVVFGNSSTGFSLAGGVHTAKDVGLDATANLTFGLSSSVFLFTGLDMDVNLKDDADMPIWFFVGIEAALQRNFSLLLETGVGISDEPPTVVSVGVSYMF